MSLRIITTDGQELVSPAVIEALQEGLGADGRAVLLVPTLRQALDAQLLLANRQSLSLSVTVTTPDAWADERWEVWGDGRRLVSARERLLLLRQALDGSAGMLAPTSGTVDALTQLVRDVLPYLPGGEADARWAALGEGDRAACQVVQRYRALLDEQGLAERCEALALLAEAVPSWPRVVVSGATRMPRATRDFLLGVAARSEVHAFLPEGAAAGADGASGLAELLACEAGQRGMAVRRLSCPPSPSAQADELQGLRSRVFRDASANQPLVAGGAVRLLQPSGPLAEWELVAREVGRLSDEGMADVVVAVPSVEDAWRGLAPRLAARRVQVSCTVRRPASRDGSVGAFLGFATTVAQLADLAQGWPSPLDGPEGPVPQLGDMSWWPPKALTDFLLSDVSTVDAARAWELDARWRGNRSLSPATVLDQLQRESLTSKAVAQATASVMRGRLGTAALQLARALDESGNARPEALAALSCIQDVARTIGSLGIAAALRKGVRTVLAPSQIAALVAELVGHESLSARLVLGPQDAACTVRICSRGEASALGGASADALVCCGLTSAEWPLSPQEDAATELARRLGLDDGQAPLDLARAQFRAMLAVPRHRLVLERSLHDKGAKPTYCAVVLSEALACYEQGGSLLEARALGEDGASALLCASGQVPEPSVTLENASTGSIGDGARAMVLVPREGDAALPGGVPSLSASQIESYLECPYKWFTLRRLGLGSQDAGFAPVQMGTFAHRVLEVARRRMAQEAAEAAGLVPAGQLLSLDGTEATYLPGSQIDDATIEHVRELVQAEFDYHLMHQRQHATTLMAQSLVPHTATEEYRLGRFRRELLSVLDFERTRLTGFTPRYFELRFGGSGAKAHHVTYAGVDFLGSIDRVDVDSHGNAVVIDYKHMGSNGFASQYDAFAKESPATISEVRLPRRVQSLIYAQVVRRLFPHLNVVGAVYLSTMGMTASEHELAGVLDADVADRVMGRGLTSTRLAHLVAGGVGKVSFVQLLDATEQLIAKQIKSLLEGHIEADPIDDKACAWCPVANCERRRS